MARIPWPEFANRWLWLCPLTAIVLAAAIFWSIGLVWWSALLAAVMLVCPALIVWGLLQVVREQRQTSRRWRH